MSTRSGLLHWGVGGSFNKRKPVASAAAATNAEKAAPARPRSPTTLARDARHLLKLLRSKQFELGAEIVGVEDVPDDSRAGKHVEYVVRWELRPTLEAQSWTSKHRYTHFKDLDKRIKEKFAQRSLPLPFFPQAGYLRSFNPMYLETKRLALFQYLSALLSMKDVTFSYEMARFVLERMDRGQRDFPTIVEELVQSVEGRTVGSRSYSAGSDLSETPGSSSLLAVPASVGVEGTVSHDNLSSSLSTSPSPSASSRSSPPRYYRPLHLLPSLSAARDPLLTRMLKRAIGGKDLMTGNVKVTLPLYTDRADVLESLGDGNIIITLADGQAAELEIDVEVSRFDQSGNVQGSAVVNGHEAEIRITISDWEKMEGIAAIKVAVVAVSEQGVPAGTNVSGINTEAELGANGDSGGGGLQRADSPRFGSPLRAPPSSSSTGTARVKQRKSSSPGGLADAGASAQRKTSPRSVGRAGATSKSSSSRKRRQRMEEMESLFGT